MSASPGCDGPNNTRYSETLGQCVGSAYPTSCTGSDTCYYGFANLAPTPRQKSRQGLAKDPEPVFFAGRIVQHRTTNKPVFQVTVVGPLEGYGIQAGHYLDLGCRVTHEGVGKYLSKFVKDTPARAVEVLFDAKGIHLTLRRK